MKHKTRKKRIVRRKRRTFRRIVGNGPYSKTILKVLHSPIEAYSRGKRIPDLYEALLIRFGSGELGIMIGWRNRNGELIQTPGAWTLDSLKGVSDSIAIDYGQGWTVRGMHGAIAEAKSDASYRIRDLKGNPMRSSFDRPTFGPGQAEYRRVDTTTMAGIKEAERLQRAGWYTAQTTPFSTTYYRRKIRKIKKNARRKPRASDLARWRAEAKVRDDKSRGVFWTSTKDYMSGPKYDPARWDSRGVPINTPDWYRASLKSNRRRSLRRNPAKRDFYGDVYIGKKKVDSVFVRSISEGSKRERELDVMDELLSMPNSYKLAWVRKPNGLYDVRKGFRVRET
jgi:hypothetical protein